MLILYIINGQKSLIFQFFPKIMPSSLSKRLIFFCILLPFTLWLFIFKGSFLGRSAILHDTYANYCMFKYFYNNLFNGIVPLWEPFVFLGRPEHYSGVSGVLNPLALFIFSFHFIGFNYLQLYLIYLAVYFLLGVTGFFLLCQLIFKHDSYALIATWFLIFSGVGGTLFFQVNEVMLFVTAVWFFVFLLRFYNGYKASDFWGIILSIMVSLFSNYPFYLICLFIAFLSVYIILFFNTFILQVKQSLIFIGNHKIILICAIVCLLIAGLPLILFKVLNSSGEIISLARHPISIHAITDKSLANAQLTYEEVAEADSLADIYGGGDWFAIFSFFHSDDLSFLPLFCFIILFISIWTFLERSSVLVFATGFLIFLTGLGGVTPFYHFLYDHIFFFKYFRNLYFFTIYLLPLTIIFAIYQLKAVIEKWSCAENKIIPLLFMTIGHLIFYLLLRYFGCLFFVSYLTLLLSFVFFTALILGVFKRHWFFMIGCLFSLSALQPWVLLNYYQKNFPGFTEFPLPPSHAASQFNYLRPSQDDPHQPYGSTVYCMYPLLASFKDASGTVIFQPDLIEKYIIDFFHRFPLKEQKIYLRHKIVVYDQDPDLVKDNNPPQYILNDSTAFKILHFDVNSLAFQSDFPSNKFLVYNDAFSKFWKVSINGKMGRIYLANDAFKGVFLPSGKDSVLLRYCPYDGEWVYVMVLITSCLAFIYLIFLNFQFKDTH